ncbi:MAG: KH domain-containing protein [Acidimicrobiales bacterium]
MSDEAQDDEAEDDDPDFNRRPGATAIGVLEYLVRSLVDEPDAVEIDVDEDRRGLTVRVSVAPDDMGRVIGRRGRIANAIRTLVRAAAVRDEVEVVVDFVD